MISYSTCFVTTAPSGSAHYRASLPAWVTGSGLIARDRKLNPIKLAPPFEPEHVDVYVYHLPMYQWQLDEIHERQAEGCIVVADVDDYLPSIIGKQDHEHGRSGAFDQELIDKHLECLRACDAIIASVPALEELLARHGLKVDAVVGNYIDLHRFDPNPNFDLVSPSGQIVLGWQGSTGHGSALKSVASAINDVMARNPDTYFVSIGDPAAALIEHEDRRQHIEFLPMTMHAQVVRLFDVNLGPGKGDEFYRAKSPLRFLEAAAAKSAFLGHATTYGSIAKPGRTHFTYDTLEQFERQLEWLVASRDTRKHMAQRARKWVQQYGNIDTDGLEAWRTALDSIYESVRGYSPSPS